MATHLIGLLVVHLRYDFESPATSNLRRAAQNIALGPEAPWHEARPVPSSDPLIPGVSSGGTYVPERRIACVGAGKSFHCK